MINPKYMTDKDLIAELQGWPPFFAEISELDVDRSMYIRFHQVLEEFKERMGHDLPRPGTEEEIEEERERAQTIAETLPLPKKLARADCIATLKTDEAKQAIDEAIAEGLKFYGGIQA